MSTTIRQVVRDVLRDWVSLVSGLLSVILFFGALIVSTITTQELVCWIGAYFFLIVGWVSYVWRRSNNDKLARLKVLRLLDRGERLRVELETTKQEASIGIYPVTVEIVGWWRECLEMVNEYQPRLMEHFTDLGELNPGDIEMQIGRMMKRLREAFDTTSMA